MAEVASSEAKSTTNPPSPGARSPRIGNAKTSAKTTKNCNESNSSIGEATSSDATSAAPPLPPSEIAPATTATTTTKQPLTTLSAAACVAANNKSLGNSSPRSPKHPRRSRIRLNEQQLETATRDELAAKWREQDLYVECLEAQVAAQEGELVCLRDSEEKYRQQCCEVSHRERILVRRLASKEQQLLGYVNQITEMRSAATPSASALRSALLDPAVNILVQKLRQELQSTKAKLEDTQNELSAWKFTPDSNTGKRLMAKCRLLYQENEELGRMIASGRIAKLEGELALQKSFSEEVKKSQSELDEFLQDLDEDVEGMQSTIYFLQQELRKARESVSLLQQENNAFKSVSSVSTPPVSSKLASQTSDTSLSNGLSSAIHGVTKKKEETSSESVETRVSGDVTKIQEANVDSPSATPPQILPSQPCAQISVPFNPVATVEDSEFSDRNRPDEPDESSNDSAALIIKVDNEELSEREDDDDEEDDDEARAETCETRGPQRQSSRTKDKPAASTTKLESVIVGKSNGDEKNSSRTSSRRLVRERTAKREKSAVDSDEDTRRQHKKKRRESILSLDYNEEDALLLTNGESIQSEPEDGP